jgi:hypothetical protein
MPTQHDTLLAGRSLILRPDTYCKGARARDIDGNEVPVFDRSAYSFCSKGALLRALGRNAGDADVASLERILSKAAGELRGTGELNYIGYHEMRTHAEVIAMWDGALVLSKATLATTTS